MGWRIYCIKRCVMWQMLASENDAVSLTAQ